MGHSSTHNRPIGMRQCNAMGAQARLYFTFGKRRASSGTRAATSARGPESPLNRGWLPHQRPARANCSLSYNSTPVGLRLWCSHRRIREYPSMAAWSHTIRPRLA